jgi:hypothetical protein
MAKQTGDLSSPMTNMFPQPPKGGDAGGGGDKEGWNVMNALGAPKAAADEPSLQITQDIGGSLNGRTMPMPSGTAMKVPSDKR